MRERRRETALGAVGVGSAVHELLEGIDLAAPAVPADLAALQPDATPEELERIEGFLASYCGSKLAARISALEGARKEAVVLVRARRRRAARLHRRARCLGPHALVVDFKTNALEGASPEEVTEADYGLQRLVYALACFRAGAEKVEVVYQFLEQPDEPVVTMFASEDVPQLEAQLSAAIGRIRAGAFVPTPSERACADCPALDVVCAGTRLRTAVGA